MTSGGVAADPRSLRVALLAYRGDPHCGGQGVYVHHLSRELVRLGHSVEVFAGQPYPKLADGVRLRRTPSLDLYRADDPFRTPRLGEFRDLIDVVEVATMWTAGFPEPLTFSLRAARELRRRRHEFDVAHDNQCLGYGLLSLVRAGLPVLATVHHPITVDRDLELAAARGWRRLTLRRWYGFARMQRQVARRLPELLTVSAASRAQIVARFGVPAERITVAPIGVDTDVFAPDPAVPREPGRIVAIASADVPLKGLLSLVEAVAKLAAERPVELVVVGAARPGGAVAAAVERLGLAQVVAFRPGLAEADLVTLLRGAEVACVPSLYEGFSLPAVEAMACATPLVATTAGALPEVVGPDGEAALHVPPGDPAALAHALGRLLNDPELRARLGAAGRARACSRFGWPATAAATVERYRALLERRRPC